VAVDPTILNNDEYIITCVTLGQHRQEQNKILDAERTIFQRLHHLKGGTGMWTGGAPTGPSYVPNKPWSSKKDCMCLLGGYYPQYVGVNGPKQGKTLLVRLLRPFLRRAADL
jgi:hypothetical protein